jgi:hypothetical protein
MRDGAWEHPRGKTYCEGHSRAFLMAEDREDFADEWAREDRKERAAS